jgi:prephenate dehydratase
MHIGIQGELGSFSHEAALTFDPGAVVVPCMLSADAFRSLEEGKVDSLAVPIENTLAGSVVEHFDLLFDRNVHIAGESVLRIRHNLIGMPESTASTIHRVYSHPVALAQCRQFFIAHPRMEAVPFYDTAGAVKQIVALRDRHAGAIAGDRAALVHGGEILLSGIEDDPENYTRFLLVLPGPPSPAPGSELHETVKVTVAIELRHVPGSLASALTEVARTGANLTKIQARPIPGQPWLYRFFFDCVLPGAQADALLERLAPVCSRVKELGQYQPLAEAGAPEGHDGPTSALGP